MANREAFDALRATSDNMQVVYRNIDNMPFFNRPDSENKKIFGEILARFEIQKAITRRFAPQKLPTLNRLASLAKRYSLGQISDRSMFGEIKKISLQNGLDQHFVNHVKESMNIHKARVPFKTPMNMPKAVAPNKQMPIRRIKIEPFRMPQNRGMQQNRGRRLRKRTSGIAALNYLFGGRR